MRLNISIALAPGARLAFAGAWLLLASCSLAQAQTSSGRTLAEQFAEQARKVEEAQAAKAAEEERAKAEAARIAAEKLAADAKLKAEQTRKALEQLKRDEADMLERAREEANARAEAERLARERIELEKAAEAARIDAERKAEEARQAEVRRLAEEQERRRVAEEKAAADKLRAEKESAEREAKLRAEAEQRSKDQEDRRAAEAQRQAETSRQDDVRRMQAEREAENARISEILRRAREAREALAARRPPRPEPDATAAKPQDTIPIAGAGREPPPAAPQASDPDKPMLVVTPQVRPASADAAAPAPAAGPTLVTVLLVMEPGSNGIRRFQKTADPILCVRESCYVSDGAEAPAVELPRWKAFGTGNTLGKRAGACRNMLACVFRSVELGDAEALIQPVDMRIMRHDRREPLKVRADESCAVREGRLACATLVSSKDWRAWVVPEHIARTVGIDVLQAALNAGLPRARAAGLGTQ